MCAKNNTRELFLISLLLCGFLLLCSGCNHWFTTSYDVIDYSEGENWAFFPSEAEAVVDVFFIAPTIAIGNDSTLSMSLQDSVLRSKFVGAINMEKGIYCSDSTNFYAPFYRQALLNCFLSRGFDSISSDSRVEDAFEQAFLDVEEAFSYYLSISDRPFVLAGFSQGSLLIIELLKKRFEDKALQNRLIAVYAIGWRITSEEVNQFDQLTNATAEDDVGVVICYSSEAVSIDKTLIVPDKTLSINPLIWSVDTTFASRLLNKGACFTNYSGEITQEIPHFTGAFIDGKRGTLKVTDVSPKEYPAMLPGFSDGEYHLYDYMFFYRNLQQNVKKRIYTYLENKQQQKRGYDGK